jgi:hypothetical protein
VKNRKLGKLIKTNGVLLFFNCPALGFAASNKHHEFIPPYTQIWKTADILVSQNLYILAMININLPVPLVQVSP